MTRPVDKDLAMTVTLTMAELPDAEDVDLGHSGG